MSHQWTTTEQAYLDALTRDDQDEANRLASIIDAEDQARKQRLGAPEALAGAALWYARNGIACFPLRPGEKRPATAHWRDDATTSQGQIAQWWERSPQANIGLPTGLRFDVIDVDAPHGWESLAKLRAADLVPPVIAYASTPRGGLHLYIHPTGATVGTGIGNLPGIDYRGIGGYVVGAPSRTDAGIWEWTTPIDPSSLPPVTT